MSLLFIYMELNRSCHDVAQSQIYFINGYFREGVLLGYGNPLLDIQVNGTQDFLDK